MSRDLEKAVKWALATAADDSHGYDQSKRTGPDYDCSSFLAAALIAGGFSIKANSTTRNLYTQLKQESFVEVSGPPKRGDIYLTPDKHVVLAISDTEIVHASLNEKGTTRGGKTGDQTGKEICTRSFYTPEYGWKYHLRYKAPGQSVVKPTAQYFDYVYKGTYRTTDKTGQHLRLKADDGSDILATFPYGTNVRCYGYYSVDKKNRVWVLVKANLPEGTVTGFAYFNLLHRV